MTLRILPILSRMLWAGAFLVAACTGDQVPAPTTHTVEIREMEFHPAVSRVSPGDTIVWINRDFVPHTATAPDSAWTSPPLLQGERWEMVVGTDESGTYICAFHPVMEARLDVKPSLSDEE